MKLSNVCSKFRARRRLSKRVSRAVNKYKSYSHVASISVVGEQVAEDSAAMCQRSTPNAYHVVNIELLPENIRLMILEYELCYVDQKYQPDLEAILIVFQNGMQYVAVYDIESTRYSYNYTVRLGCWYIATREICNRAIEF